MSKLSVTVTPVGLTAYFLWTAPADGSQSMRGILIENNKGSVELPDQSKNHLYFKIIGAALGNLSVEIKNQAGKSLLKVEKSTIPLGDTDLIGAREFTA